MRDPNRIDEFCETLREAWHEVPGWRFGQLVPCLTLDKDLYYVDNDMEDTIRHDFAIGDKAGK